MARVPIYSISVRAAVSLVLIAGFIFAELEPIIVSTVSHVSKNISKAQEINVYNVNMIIINIFSIPLITPVTIFNVFEQTALVV